MLDWHSLMAEKEIKIIQSTKNHPEFRAGDTVRVWQKIVDRIVEKDKVKEKKRLQAFEGLVLARKHGKEAGATFTVRKVVDGVGVERIFPLFSPTVDKIEVLRTAKVRQAKLYHIRKKAAKEIKREMSATRMSEGPTVSSEMEVKAAEVSLEAAEKVEVGETVAEEKTAV